MATPKIVILASGAGSLAQAIIEAVETRNLDAQIISVISDCAGAQVLDRAAQAGIATRVIPMQSDRLEWNRQLISALEEIAPDLVVSAGFMRVISADCVSKFKIVNSHPALLPLFPGAHAVRDALAAKVRETGTTIHWVDSGVDTGEILAQEKVEITELDTEESLHERIKIVERRLYVATLQTILSNLMRK